MADFTDLQLMVLEKERIECRDVMVLLGDYCDNELPHSLHARLEEHIGDCDYCREVTEGYLLTIALAKQLNDAPIPDGVQNRLRASLNKKLGLNLGMVE